MLLLGVSKVRTPSKRFRKGSDEPRIKGPKCKIKLCKSLKRYVGFPSLDKGAIDINDFLARYDISLHRNILCSIVTVDNAYLHFKSSIRSSVY